MLCKLIDKLLAHHKLVELKDVQVFNCYLVSNFLDFTHTSEIFINDEFYTL